MRNRLTSWVLAALVATVLSARAAQEIRLVPGENFFGLAVAPADASLGALLGSAGLPAGADASDSAIFRTYDKAAEPSAIYRLDAGGHWLDEKGGVVDGYMLEPGRGYGLVLPASHPAITVSWAGDDVTAPVVVAVSGEQRETSYAVLAWPRSRPVAVKELGLKEAGMVGGVNPTLSDEIRILDNSSGMGTKQSPKARIWLNAVSGRFELSPSGDPADDVVIQPGEVLIVVRKRAPALAWSVPN